MILCLVAKGDPYPNVNEANWPREDCVKVRVRAHGLKFGAIIPKSTWNGESQRFVKDVADRLNVVAEFVHLPARTLEQRNRDIEEGVSFGSWRQLVSPGALDNE